MEDYRAIAVLPEDMSDEQFNYLDARFWAFAKIDANLDVEMPNVIRITEKEIYALTDVWDIVNEINDNSMIGVFEDDAIFSQEILISILDKLNIYLETLEESRNGELLIQIIDLFNFAIRIKHAVYFCF